MGRYSTSPLVVEDSLDLSLSFLKSRGYVKPNHSQSGVITWSRGGVKTGAIRIWIKTEEETGVAVLNYEYRGDPKTQEIELVTIPSNLGAGRLWYFICTRTGDRARKLYCFSNGEFLSRGAYKDLYYESQLRSKFTRSLDNTLGKSLKAERYYSQIYSKGFTKYYNGKKTRRYKDLLAKIERSERTSLKDQNFLESLLYYR